METYNTEEEQIEALKRFWKEYGLSIVGGAVIGVGGWFGYGAYQEHQVSQSEAASEVFSRLIETPDPSLASLESGVDQLQADHGKSGYSSLADLQLARSAVQAGDLELAESRLIAAAAQIDSASRPIVQLRLARVQLEMQAFDKAEKTISSIDAEAFEVQRAELRGDLLLAQGDEAGAKSAYLIALIAGGAETSPTLQLKLDELAHIS